MKRIFGFCAITYLSVHGHCCANFEFASVHGLEGKDDQKNDVSVECKGKAEAELLFVCNQLPFGPFSSFTGVCSCCGSSSGWVTGPDSFPAFLLRFAEMKKMYLQ